MDGLPAGKSPQSRGTRLWRSEKAGRGVRTHARHDDGGAAVGPEGIDSAAEPEGGRVPATMQSRTGSTTGGGVRAPLPEYGCACTGDVLPRRFRSAFRARIHGKTRQEGFRPAPFEDAA